MQLLGNALAYLGLWSTLYNDVDETSACSINSAKQRHLLELSSDLVIVVAALLPAHSIVRFASANQQLHTLLRCRFPATFQAVVDIKNLSSGTPVGKLFTQAINSIQAISIRTQQPALLRDLVLTLEAGSQRFDTSPGGCDDGFDSGPFYDAISQQESEIAVPPRCQSDALSLIDLIVARYAGCASFKRCANRPFDLLKMTNKAFWPAMLDSLMANIQPDKLKREITLFAEEYEGTVHNISTRLAAELAVIMLVNDCNDWGDVRSVMHRRFGVMTEAQWHAINHRIATRVYVSCLV
ncbi:hypothetical protein [Robbsia andropogonis]|uniref:hypothetical protein n=1 Tax=Robbsia andropogonis TaxID=28092 RepID=UPI0004634478|nr:hypothetical protein [Robbsia andropogonis]